MERDSCAPAKIRSRSSTEQPDAALVTLRAEGTLGTGVTCSVATGRAIAEAGLHPATGGDGLAVLGRHAPRGARRLRGCHATGRRDPLDLPIRSGTVRVEGDLDFRGTSAVAKDAPVGFRAIRVRFDLDADATTEQLDTLLRLTERYCVVLQTLARSPELSVSRNVSTTVP